MKNIGFSRWRDSCWFQVGTGPSGCGCSRRAVRQMRGAKSRCLSPAWIDCRSLKSPPLGDGGSDVRDHLPLANAWRIDRISPERSSPAPLNSDEIEVAGAQLRFRHALENEIKAIGRYPQTRTAAVAPSGTDTDDSSAFSAGNGDFAFINMKCPPVDGTLRPLGPDPLMNALRQAAVEQRSIATVGVRRSLSYIGSTI